MPDLASAYAPLFRAFEVFSVTIFTIEYGLRIWTAVEMPFLARMRPWRARLHLATRGYLIIDLLAILPFYLGGLLGLDLRVLRVLRLLRFFKLSRYSPAMHTLLRVLHNERRSLMGAGLLLTAALLLSATGMYYIEGATQPDKFGSVPQAAYWAMTTLTTVGYGDVAPVTPLGKLWSMMTMLCRAVRVGPAGGHHLQRLCPGGRPPRLRRHLVADVAHSAAGGARCAGGRQGDAAAARPQPAAQRRGDRRRRAVQGHVFRGGRPGAAEEPRGRTRPS